MKKIMTPRLKKVLVAIPILAAIYFAITIIYPEKPPISFWDVWWLTLPIAIGAWALQKPKAIVLAFALLTMRASAVTMTVSPTNAVLTAEETKQVMEALKAEATRMSDLGYPSDTVVWVTLRFAGGKTVTANMTLVEAIATAAIVAIVVSATLYCGWNCFKKWMGTLNKRSRQIEQAATNDLASVVSPRAIGKFDVPDGKWSGVFELGAATMTVAEHECESAYSFQFIMSDKTTMVADNPTDLIEFDDWRAENRLPNIGSGTSCNGIPCDTSIVGYANDVGVVKFPGYENARATVYTADTLNSPWVKVGSLDAPVGAVIHFRHYAACQRERYYTIR